MLDEASDKEAAISWLVYFGGPIRSAALSARLVNVEEYVGPSP
jgi:hypothetical protein